MPDFTLNSASETPSLVACMSEMRCDQSVTELQAALTSKQIGRF